MIHGNKHKEFQFNDLSRFERKSFFVNQLKNILREENYDESEIKKIINRTHRIINFFINYTDIRNVSDIENEHVLQYMKHSMVKSYLKISFKELRRELELFYTVLDRELAKNTKFDMSIQNYSLWSFVLSNENSIDYKQENAQVNF